MRPSIYLIIISLMLTACLETTETYVVEGQLKEPGVEWIYGQTCDLYDGECPVEPPKVYFVPLPNGIWGKYFHGMDSVMINTYCLDYEDQTKCAAVVVHEMVHYIDWHNTPEMDLCVAESRAWDVYNQFVMKLGRLDLVKLDWQKHYEDC